MTSPSSSRAGVRRARICGRQAKLPVRPREARDDVGDLAGEAGNVERRAVDDVDPDDIGGADPAELGEDVGRSAGEALAVDQHVARSPRPGPRRSVSPASIEKPGTLFSMSSALRGAKRAKSAGV